MRRVLVPLDGSTLSAVVLDDARRFAGPQGELILMQLVPERAQHGAAGDKLSSQSMKAQTYLEAIAGELQAQGVKSSTLVLPTRNIPLAINEAAIATWADIIACATYSQAEADPALQGGIAWRVLAHGSVELRNDVDWHFRVSWSPRYDLESASSQEPDMLFHDVLDTAYHVRRGEVHHEHAVRHAMASPGVRTVSDHVGKKPS